jgi:hypothetical protein
MMMFPLERFSRKAPESWVSPLSRWPVLPIPEYEQSETTAVGLLDQPRSASAWAAAL